MSGSGAGSGPPAPPDPLAALQAQVQGLAALLARLPTAQASGL